MNKKARQDWLQRVAVIDLKTLRYAPDGTGDRRGGCALCGGPVTVTDYVTPFNGSAAPEVRGLVGCETCRVDRVKRWSDLFKACPEAARERSSVFPFPPPRPVLERRGLVERVRDEGAWILTAKGEALLNAFDAGVFP